MCATFLGDSQTFFGVLVTLTVVCLFLDQNNFIVEFLKNIQDVFVKKIADMHQDIVSKTKVSWGKNTDKQNKTFEFYYKNAEGNDELLMKGLTIVDNIEFARQQSENNITSIEADTRKGCKLITDAPAYVYSALYVFLFSVIVFILDTFVKRYFLLVSFLWLFTIFSYALLISVWLHYWEYTKLNYQSQVYKKLWKLKWWQTLGIFCILTSFVGEGILWIFSQLQYSINIQQFIFVFVGVSGIFFLGKRLFKTFCDTTDFNRHFLVSHCLYFLLSAFIIASIFQIIIILSYKLEIEQFVLFQKNVESCLMNVENLRFLVLAFVIFNILILPIILPYIKYKKLKSEAFQRMEKEKNDFDAKLVKIKNEFEKYKQEVIDWSMEKESSPNPNSFSSNRLLSNRKGKIGSPKSKPRK